MRRQTYLALALALLLAPNAVSAESCSDGSEWLELELRSVVRVDGADAPEETNRWATEGSAVVGYQDDSFARQKDTVRLESLLREGGDLRIVLTEEE